MRLDRFLSEQTALTRRECTAAILHGRVSADGSVLRKPDAKIDPEAVRITLDGKAVIYAKQHYFLMHKPEGVITATRDRSLPTVLDLLRPEDRLPGLFPCGRLDRDTAGLLLITDDGALAHRMLSPKHHVTKYYLAELARPFEDAYIPKIAAGITLREGDCEEQCLPAECVKLDDTHCVLGLREGKYHEVRRMLAALGNHVLHLLRTGIGGLLLPPDLPSGGYAAICTKDVESLLKVSSISSVTEFCSAHYSSYWIKDKA